MIRYEICERILTVSVEGEIDHHSAAGLRGEIDGLVRKYSPLCLILDFSGVDFCDSSGIAIVLGRYKLMKQYGGTVTLTKVSPQISRIFDLSGVWNIIGRKEVESK